MFKKMPETNKKVGVRPTFDSDSTLLLKHRRSISPNDGQAVVALEFLAAGNRKARTADRRFGRFVLGVGNALYAFGTKTQMSCGD